MHTVLPCLRQLQHHLLHLHLSLAVVQAQLLLYQALGRPQSLPNFVHFPWFQKQTVDLFLSLLCVVNVELATMNVCTPVLLLLYMC